MIALDTNVIVRYLANNDAEQAEAARALLEGMTADRQGFICRDVVIEVVWVLEWFYEFTRAQIANLMILLTATRSEALPLYRFDQKLARMEEVVLVESAEGSA